MKSDVEIVKEEVPAPVGFIETPDKTGGVTERTSINAQTQGTSISVEKHRVVHHHQYTNIRSLSQC